jgi:Ca2+-binding RTX toxin-like protein
VGCVAAALTPWTLTGCGSSGETPSATTGGTDGAAAAGAGGDGAGAQGGTSGGGAKGGKGGSSGKGGSGGKGGSDAGGTSGDAGDPGTGGTGGDAPFYPDPTELEPGADGAGFDGVNTSASDLFKAVSGCTAFDAETGVLELVLDSAAPSAILRVTGGVVSVNGKLCASSDGKTRAETGLVETIRVTGGAEDSFVFVDTASAFGEQLLAGERFDFELGDGNDLVVVLGTVESDEIFMGSEGDATLIDFSGDLAADISARGVEQVVVSTGPKPDVVSGSGVELQLEPVQVPMQLFGGGANDRLTGGAGADEVSGGIGNDTLLAGADAGGADTLVGGAGEDFADYAGRAEGMSVTLAGGADDGAPDEHDNVDASIENLRGGDGDDHLIASSASNKLWGGAGADRIEGGDGDDFVFGGDGDDELEGQEGSDFLYGEDGDDGMLGGNGDDLLDGYPGTNVLDAGDGDADICITTTVDSRAGCEL